MDLRKLGSTGLLVSPIGLGLAALGRPGYINLGHADDLDRNYGVTTMQARAHAVLDAAFEDGVRYYDAARSYGRGEEFLGSWLKTRALPPRTVTVGSKWGYTYTAGWKVQAEVHEVKEHSLAVLQRQWGESQSNLSDHLDLYQVRSATIESGVLVNKAVLAELAKLKQRGTTIGLTVSGAQQRKVIELALEVFIEGARLFDCVQATWNLLERSVGPILAAAAQEGLGIIVKEALANGRLTDQNADPAFARQRTLLRAQARRLDTTVDALALAGVLAQPWVSLVLSGAARVDHLRSNLKALDVSWDETASESLQGLVEAPQQYWEIRSRLRWN